MQAEVGVEWEWFTEQSAAPLDRATTCRASRRCFSEEEDLRPGTAWSKSATL